MNDRIPRVRRRSSFHAAMVILILDAFSYANDWQDAPTTILWAAIGFFWLAFSVRRVDRDRERRNAAARREFYRRYFGAFDVFAPWIPYLLLLTAFLVMRFLPSLRWLVWTLTAAAAVYVTVTLFLMARYLRRRRMDDAARAARTPPPWDGADGAI